MTPLAPTLYAALKRRFPKVVVANQGERFVAGRRVNPFTRKVEEVPQASGEYYRVDCPFCNDDRQRLWINHCFGTTSEITGSTRYYLAHCYNEDCLADFANRQQLEEMVFGLVPRGLRNHRAPVPVIEETATVKPTEFPGEVVALSDLPLTHPAIDYLRSRRVNLKELDRDFDVRVCTKCEKYRHCVGRIITPVFFDDMLVGWQARYVGDDWAKRNAPKYFTMPGMPKRLILYNFDQARKSRVLVVHEGVTDVWATGKRATAVFGKTITVGQERLLSQWWSTTKGLLVFMLDGGVEAEKKRDGSNKLLEAVNNWRRRTSGQCVMVTLPPDRDAANYSRPAIWDFIRGAAAQADLNLDSFLN